MAVPTTHEIANVLIDSESLAEWAGFSKVVPQQPASASAIQTSGAGAAQPSAQLTPLEAFLKFTGTNPTAHYRTLAALPTAMWDTMIGGFTVNGTAANMAELGAAKLFHTTARCICNLDAWPNAAAPTTAPPTAAAPPPNAASTSRPLNTPTIKLDQVLDQKLSEEITYLPLPDIVRYEHNYQRIMEEPPTPATKPTSEQLTALQYVIQSMRVPYVELNLFGPFGSRTLRKIKLTALMMVPGGEFRTVEILGPCDIATWEQSYAVLRSAFIMLEAVRRPALDRYLRKIQYLSEQWGDICWGVLYQADVRCRGELMETIHHQHLLDHNNAVTAGKPTTYNAAMPWDAVWDQATKDSEWWKTEFDMPAMKIKFERAPPARVLADAGLALPVRPQRPAQPGQPKPKAQTKKGELCRDFNNGKCSPSTDGMCPRHPGAIHRCAQCNSTAHGRTECGKRKQDDWKNGKQGDKKKGNKGRR
jgi:hypothetical protein